MSSSLDWTGSLTAVGFTVFQPDALSFVPRENDPRSVARLSDALSESRANVWRYPPGSIGRRHRDLGQEEVFVILNGTLTVDVGEPPERHEVGRGGIVVVERGTILQLRNAGDQELVLFIYGAPPETGKSEFFEGVA
jgi:mannose-6-phosphate isomerase-like protein (cupin superfamily)